MAMWGLFKQRPDLEEPLGALFRKYRDNFQAHDRPTGKEPPDTASTPYLDRALEYLHEALVHQFRPMRMRESMCKDFCPDIEKFLKQKDVKPFLSHHAQRM